ncbi:MAG: SGNH/GDSL hydrolase family protein [Deltaproteobacteria bacterium]|nr:SGNH/GDSL hydrolase family protein [Deltaproteobacteria bacterium]
MRWLFVGDSITVGMTESLGRRMLAHEQTAEVVSSVGLDVEGAIENPLVLEALGRRPRVVVVALGTNPYGITSSDRFREAVRRFLTLVWSVTDVVGWVSPWAGTDHDQRQLIIREFVPVRWADGLLLGRGLDRVGEDRVHFTTSAYEALGRRVADWAVRVVEPRALTGPRVAGKVISVFGVAVACAAPMTPELIGGLWR